VPLTVTFDGPVTNAPVTFTSSDTALVAFNTSVTGTSKQHGASTTKGLAKPVSATVTAVSGSESRSVVVQVIPNQLADFTVSPASGSGGATLAATARLTRTALQSQALLLVSSDTSVATVASPLVFTVGEDVKIISILLKPQSTQKSATITATMQANSNVGAANTINTRTITVTAIP